MIKKRTFTSLLVCIMVICTLFTTSIPVSAETCSNGTATCTITVKTQANWWQWGSESITLSQTKGLCKKDVFEFWPDFGYETVRKEVYGKWNIKVVATDGSHEFKKNLTGDSVYLNLKPDKTYTITVSWDKTHEQINCISNGEYVTYPTWKVSATHKVVACY